MATPPSHTYTTPLRRCVPHRVFSFTRLQARERLLPILAHPPWGEDARVDKRPRVLQEVEAWLESRERLIERVSGRPLRRAAFVRVDEGGRVVQVDTLSTDVTDENAI